MRQISIAIPSWNRYEQTVNSFKNVIDDERIREVVIVDDASTDDSYDKLKWHFRDNNKVRIFKNETNLDCYFNKKKAMEKATSDFCILFDSDNTLGTDYIDALFNIAWWDKFTAYQPEFSKPHFDFRKHSGVTLTKSNVNDYLHTNLETALNAMNFFINREQFLKVWDGSIDPVTSDSIYFNFCWLKANNKIKITPHLEYDHFISEDGTGHYQQNHKRTGNFHQELLQRFKTELK